MPLGPAYDKLIDSKFADMKNTGGRNAGSITAAQFLKRFVGDTPWAHLDIAGAGDELAGERHQSLVGFGLGRAAAGSTRRGVLRELRIARPEAERCGRDWQARWPRSALASRLGAGRRAPTSSCDAFIDKLRTAASDLGVDFSHALVVSRARSDIDVFDITTKSEIDGDTELPRRPAVALRGANRPNRRATRADSRVRGFPGGGAARGARLGGGQGANHGARDGAGRARISQGLARARRRLHLRQDRGARAGRRQPRPDRHRHRHAPSFSSAPNENRGAGGRIPLSPPRAAANRSGACPTFSRRRWPRAGASSSRRRRRNGSRRSTSGCGPTPTKASCRTARRATASRKRSRSI